MNKKQRKIVAVVGPTGSGKTGLAVLLAKEFDGEIVSADSRQVFRGLDLGTGKDLDDLKGVKYHMIDICDPEEEFTLFDWLDGARNTINEIFDRGKIPIVVGGTGLYVQALVEGFQIGKDTRDNNQTNSKSQNSKFDRKDLNLLTLKDLQKIVQNLNIDVTNIDQKNPRRLIRAIEKFQNQENPTKIKPDFESILIAPKHTREKLYDRIDKRLDQRFEEGMLQETEDLIKNGVDSKWLITLGLDYKIMTKHLIEKSNFEDMVKDLKVKEHQYAKRQLTWWKRFDVKWIDDYKEVTRLVSKFLVK